jgi:hypothetical protein
MGQAREAVAVSNDSRPNIRIARDVLRRVCRSALRYPVRTLASKIASFVFLTALVASLAVTWVSAQSVQEFLREKIDQRLPAVLASVNERLASWYDQREIDVQTFASSATLRKNMIRVVRSERAIDEVEQYLGYLLVRFNQYESLFVLDSGPETPALVWVGEPLALPEPIRTGLGAVTSSRIGREFDMDGIRYQVVSAPIVDDANHRVASLHAIVDLAKPLAEIHRDGLSPKGGVYVVSSEGRVLMQTDSDAPRTHHARQPPFRGRQPDVEVYEVDGRERVVGSAVRFDRFDWTIAVEEPETQLFGSGSEIVRRVVVVNIGIVLLCSLVAFQIARSVVRPIQALRDAAVRVAIGEPDVPFPEMGSVEIGVLGGTFT